VGGVQAGVDAAHPYTGGRLRRGEGRHLLTEVAGAQNEVLEALARVELDDVPEDRPAADLDEGLGDGVGVLLQTGPAPSAEDDHRGQA